MGYCVRFHGKHLPVVNENQVNHSSSNNFPSFVENLIPHFSGNSFPHLSGLFNNNWTLGIILIIAVLILNNVDLEELF